VVSRSKVGLIKSLVLAYRYVGTAKFFSYFDQMRWFRRFIFNYIYWYRCFNCSIYDSWLKCVWNSWNKLFYDKTVCLSLNSSATINQTCIARLVGHIRIWLSEWIYYPTVGYWQSTELYYGYLIYCNLIIYKVLYSVQLLYNILVGKCILLFLYCVKF